MPTICTNGKYDIKTHSWITITITISSQNEMRVTKIFTYEEMRREKNNEDE